jgi:hypothetical protein
LEDPRDPTGAALSLSGFSLSKLAEDSVVAIVDGEDFVKVGVPEDAELELELELELDEWPWA